MNNKLKLRQALANLSLPFPAKDIEWRAGQVTKDGKKCSLLAYITARAVMDRLDEVVGPENWQANYQASPIGNGLECQLSIRMLSGEWVTKTDAAEPTQIESVKGAYSDALKRAAVHWGIGRYLYNLDMQWATISSSRTAGAVYISSKGKSGYAKPPKLPSWAIPKAPAKAKAKVEAPAEAEAPANTSAEVEAPAEVAAVEHDAEWQKDRKWFCAAMDNHGGYERVKAYTMTQGWLKPSVWGRERRRNFVQKLTANEIIIPKGF